MSQTVSGTRDQSDAAPPEAHRDLTLAAYNQNFETFRALNALMWQIPLIAMTLTGGLWFGVSSISKDSGLAFLRPGLLLLAGVGDVLLIVILERLRHIIGEYLAWLAAAHPSGHVAAAGVRWWNSRRIVKTCFQLMLGFAAVASFVLFGMTMTATIHAPNTAAPKSAIDWYDDHADDLADGYEGLDPAGIHPELFQSLRGVKPVAILDIGSGTGRDAAALADLGHRVTAVEPSSKMLRLARALHPGSQVKWLSDAMPGLEKVEGTYDVILLSAVWMHVPPADRAAALSRVVDLTPPRGRVFVTLRLGQGDVDRGIWSVSAAELSGMAAARGLATTDLGRRPDMLGRNGVTWQTLLLTRRDRGSAPLPRDEARDTLTGASRR